MLIALHSVAGISGNLIPLAASASTALASASGVGDGPYTTNQVVITASGGVAPYTYAWARTAGDSTITISSSSASTVTWSGSGTAPESKSATWRCTVTDAMGITATSTITVQVSMNLATLVANLSTSSLTNSLTGSGNITTSAVSVLVSGGSGIYTYSWTKVSGTTLTVSSPGGATTNFSYNGTAPATITASYKCVVTDSLGNTANSGTVSISMTFSVPALSASVTPGSLSGSVVGGGTVTTSGSASVSVSGGQSPYTYSWSYVSGDTSVYANSGSSSSTTFSRSGAPTSSYSSVWKCTVTDSLGSTASTGNVSISLAFNASLSATLSTTSLSATQTGNGTLTTGSVSVSPSGGSGGYTYAWTYVSGDSGVTVSSSSGSTVTFSKTGTGGNTYSAVWQCVVTDSSSNTVNAGSVSLSFTFVSSLSATASPDYLSGTAYATGFVTTSASTTAVASGGSGGYSYTWTYVSGDTNIYATNPYGATTLFERYGSPVASYSAVFKCVVKDSSNTTVSSNNVTIELFFDV